MDFKPSEYFSSSYEVNRSSDYKPVEYKTDYRPIDYRADYQPNYNSSPRSEYKPYESAYSSSYTNNFDSYNDYNKYDSYGSAATTSFKPIEISSPIYKP